MVIKTNPIPLYGLPRRPVMMLIVAMLMLVLAVGYNGWWQSGTQQQSIQPSVAFSLMSPQAVSQWQARLQQNPEDVHAYAQLGLALLDEVRDTGDMVLYAKAEQAFTAALQRDPQQIDALVGQGILALARHHFAEALVWAEEAQALNPFRAQILGIKVDALVELGRYPEAVEAAQAMVNLRPDLHSYSRVSYLRELHGDVDGANAAMQAAVDAGVPGREATLWAQVHLGHLHFNQGDLIGATRIYQQALAQRPNYLFAQAGLARVQAAQGDVKQAIATYVQLVERLPLPEFVTTLGDLYAQHSQLTQATQQYALVEVMQALNREAGVAVDLEMALFNADYGNDPAAAVVQAQAAYAQRPTIYAADTLAWALYRSGQPEAAWPYSQEARRLGTQDALLYFHAGMIAHARDDITTAHILLTQALAINPAFSLRHRATVQAVLSQLAMLHPDFGKEVQIHTNQ